MSATETDASTVVFTIDEAAALPEVARLQLDPDPAVSGAATKVARKALR